MPYCFPRSSIKFRGHTGQNFTDFYPNWAFPVYRPVAAFKSLRFALFFNIFHTIIKYSFKSCADTVTCVYDIIWKNIMHATQQPRYKSTKITTGKAYLALMGKLWWDIYWLYTVEILRVITVAYCTHLDMWVPFICAYMSRLPWIFPGAPLNLHGAPANIQGNGHVPTWVCMYVCACKQIGGEAIFVESVLW